MQNNTYCIKKRLKFAVNYFVENISVRINGILIRINDFFDFFS